MLVRAANLIQPHLMDEIWELRAEAAEARDLSECFKDRAATDDLLKYAATLESMAEILARQRPADAHARPQEKEPLLLAEPCH